MDPRILAIQKRLKKVKKIIPVASSKGGVGKSLIASTLSLIKSKKSCSVGLLDLDLHGPSSHIILGAKNLNFPEEDKGVIPPKVEGIKFMSTVYYSKDKPTPLRGADISNAIKELLAISRWGEIDYLIIDMPPGIGNETLDTIKLIPKSRFLIVTTPSKVSLETVKKLINLLKEQKIPIKGIIENMKSDKSKKVKKEIEKTGERYLGSIRHDRKIEKKIGKPREILETKFARDLIEIL